MENSVPTGALLTSQQRPSTLVPTVQEAHRTTPQHTIQHDQHFLPLGVAHFGSLAEEDLVLVTDKDPVQDKLGNHRVGEVPQGLVSADISDELQALHVDQWLDQQAG